MQLWIYVFLFFQESVSFIKDEGVLELLAGVAFFTDFPFSQLVFFEPPTFDPLVLLPALVEDQLGAVGVPRYAE